MNNLKTKVADLDVGKLKAVPVNLKLCHVVNNKVFKNTKFNTKTTNVNILQKKIPDSTTLIYLNQYNTDKQNIETKLGDVDKKVSDTSGLVTTNILNMKFLIMVSILLLI